MRKLIALLLVFGLWAAGAVRPAVAQQHANGPAAPISALQVVLNGRDTGEVLDFTPGGEGLEVSVADLRRLGLVLPKGAATVQLNQVAGLTYQIDERTQEIRIQADRDAMRAALIDLHPQGHALIADVSPGAVINYDLTATADTHSGMAGVVEARAFSRAGVVDSTFAVSSYGGAAVHRLDTAWSYADPASMHRYVAGDLINGGLSWTRPVRMLGLQASSDFALRPDLVSFPTPTLKGDAAAASTVDVFVNGERSYGGQAQGGAFDVANVPVVTGLNEVSMTVTDAAGRRTTQVLPFYTSPALLARGLSSFSAEAGVIRLNYGGPDDRYAGAAASASGRLGLTDQWTVEGHGEAGPGVVQAGAGSVFASRLGLVSLAAAGSVAAGRAGAWLSAAFERVTKGFGVSAGVEGAVGPYRDLASAGLDAPMARVRLQGSWMADARTGLNIALVHTVYRGAGPNTADALAVGFSHQLRNNISLSASAYANQGQSRGQTLFFTVTALFGRAAASVSAVSSGAAPVVLAQAARSASGAPGDQDEWRVAAQNGPEAQVFAEAGRRTNAGEFTAGLDVIGGHVAGRATAAGAVALIDHGVFVSKTIDNSFAVVDTGTPGVTVFADNRPLGRTGADGRLLAPDLRPFQQNALALDPADVPLELDLDRPLRQIAPLDRVGVVVSFAARDAHQALVDLVDESSGKPLPIGSLVADASADGTLVGFDGQAFLSGLQPHNRLTVRAPDGNSCIARFDYAPIKGEVARIGPVACRRDPVS